MDEAGKPKTNFISWQDKRTEQPMAESGVSYLDFLKNHLTDSRCQTGTDLRAGMLGPVLFWFQKNKLSELDGKKAVFLSDFIVSYFTGCEITCDPTQAAGSGVYNLVDNCWLRLYLETTQISGSLLPHVVEIGTKSGEISNDISGKIGIKQGIPVYTSMGDHQAVLFSSGMDEESLSINIGTGAQVTLLSKDPIYSDTFETRPFVDGYYLNCISGLSAGRAINLFEKFVKDTIETFSAQMIQPDILKLLDDAIEQRDIDTDITCDPRFFEAENDTGKAGF